MGTRAVRRRAVAGVATGCVLVLGVGACGSSGGSDAKGAGSTTSSKVPGQSPRPTTPLPKVQVLHQIGTGAGTTKAFSVQAKWGVAWSFDCSATGGTGLVLTVLADGQPTPDAAVRETTAGGSGVQHYTSGPGTYTLKVETPCAWTVTVGNEA